jgi:cytochrome c oxidase subunit 2
VNELLRRALALPVQGSELARDIDYLHYVVIATSLVGAAGVAFAVATFLLRYRRGRARPAPVSPIPVWFETVAILGLLAIFLAFWLVGFRQYVRLRTPPAATLDVYVVAKQWMWSFSDADGRDGGKPDLIVPVGQPVRLLMTSRDVIHSFYVPELRLKQDVLPGRITTTWFEAARPGTWDILCTEYCGLEHSHMRGRVVAVPPEAYERARRQRGRGGADDLVAAGARVAAERGCLRCHTVDGTPHLAPSFAGLYGREVPLEGGDTLVADDAYLTESMMDPRARVHRGYAPIMPSYLGQLSATEAAALVLYIRSLPASPPPEAADPLPPAGSPRLDLPTAPGAP